jgi:alanyl-tRNA synthetase
VTERLYYTDSFLSSFSAPVLEKADGGRRIYLDRTAFYPTSGGQPHDTGTLGGIRIVDVVDEDDRIAHLLSEPLKTTGNVEGVIDWPRRLDHIQQHTAQHLLSAVLDEQLHARTTSVHFGDDTSTVDLDREALTEAQLAAAERRANEIIMEDRPVTISFEEPSEAEGLRKESKREGTLRIITIEGVDKSACGGTHARRTGEIGPLLVLGAERVKGKARVEFLAGWRAIGHARRNETLVRATSGALSAPVAEIPSALQSLTSQLKDARSALKKLGAEVAVSRARMLAESVEPDRDGIRRVVLTSHGYDADELRAIGQAIGAVHGVRFIATLDDPPTLFVAAGPESGWDAGAVLKAALAEVGGRGGGSARAAQGTVGDAEELGRVVGALKAEG